MSQYGLIYRLEFKNIEGFTIRTDIYPTDILIPDPDTPVVIDLKGGDQPVIIQTSNNEEDKLSVIRSKSARIKFRSDSSSGLDSATFSQGGDDLWRVDIYLQDTPELIFRGSLIMADNSQPFQPDPQYVTLTATDHLGALKELPLLSLTDAFPVGKYRVAEIIAMCLRKTGLSLKMFVVNNLRAGGGRNTMAVTITGTNTLTVADTSMFYIGQRLEINSTLGVASVFVVTKTSTVITINGAMSNGTDPAAVFLDYYSQFHWYDKVYIDAGTFEKIIGECESCYEVLTKILGEDCFITQYKGNWWIYRVDEMEGNPIYVAEFTTAGVYVSTAAGAQYNKSIGRIEDSKFANADTLLRFIRPHGFIRETFNYNTPIETPCNIDFARGALNTTISPTEKRYDLDCWDKLWSNTSSDDPQLTGIYTTRLFNANDYEIERYVTLELNATRFTFIMSELIPVNVKDKFDLQVSRRLSSDVGGSGAYRDPDVQVRLYGGDGTFWTYHPKNTGAGQNTRYWEACTSTFRTNQHFYYHEGDASEDQTEAVSLYDGVGAEVPVSGYIKILVYRSSLYGTTKDTYIDSVSFDYIPFINGSYQKYSGQSSRVDRTETGYMANRDNEVFISDSPAPLYKGSMFLVGSDGYILFPHWFAASPQGNSYPPDPTYLHPYGYIQAFSVWNQFKGYNDPTNDRGIGINIFSGSVLGLTNAWPDLIHKYTLTDSNLQTVNRYFILISLSQDWKSCIWTAVLIEVYNTAIGKTYGDPFEFKYISE